MGKYGETILSREYDFGSQHTPETALNQLADMCNEMKISAMVITSDFIMPNEKKRIEDGYQEPPPTGVGIDEWCIQLPGKAPFRFNRMDYPPNTQIIKRDQLIALKYRKYFDKDVVYLNLSSIPKSTKCQLVNGKYTFQKLMIEHQIVSPHLQDNRGRFRICEYHQYCAINFLSQQTIQCDKDIELAAFYTAELIYNSFLACPSTIFVIGGTLVHQNRSFYA